MVLRSSVVFRLILVLAVLVMAAPAVLAQAPAVQPQTEEEFPSTPEGRMKKFDLAEDPGLEPDPQKILIRYGKQYRIEKFERRWAKMDIGRPGWIRPFGFANFEYELYRADDNWAWVFVPMPDPDPEPTPEVRLDKWGDPIRTEEATQEAVQYFRDIRPEFTALQPERSNLTIRFRNSSEGLPQTGSWRNTVDVADMNGDGHLDIIAPPQRGPGGVPTIYLGDGKGNWRFWDKAEFPMYLNYGSVVAGDLNGDGHQDIVVGAHISGVFVFLGDGKGKFTASSTGLPTKFGTRRVILSDVDRDGDLDIVAISEGPMMQERDEGAPDSRLKVFLNEGKGAKWRPVNVADEHRLVAGDFLSAGDFNGDRYPDFIGSSIYYDGPDILYVSNGGKKWDPVGRGTLIPFLSLYGATASGRFSSKKADDAIIAFTRGWPSWLNPEAVEPPPLQQVIGIDRISWKGKTPVRTPIVRWGEENRVWGMTTADFNGDGHLDLAYTTQNPRAIQILLGDGKGGFKQATVIAEGLLPNINYDLKAADVNRDGRPDLVILYESSEVIATRGKNGAIQVFLNEGVEK
jgi:hypothetical protein